MTAQRRVSAGRRVRQQRPDEPRRTRDSRGRWAAVGSCGIVELTALLGYYVMVAMSINAHDLTAKP
jgi:SNF family Na+-dependent transporter